MWLPRAVKISALGSAYQVTISISELVVSVRRLVSYFLRFADVIPSKVK